MFDWLKTPPPPPPAPPPSRGIDNAWHIHQAIIDWTGKVDSKASFVLTLESALIAGVVTLSSKKRQLTGLSTWWELFWYRSGFIFLVLAVLVVVLVVAPRLRRRKAKASWQDNYIYFGHLKYWKDRAPELEAKLRNEDILPVLSRQLIGASSVAWTKHRRLQLSLLLAVVGSAFMGIAGLLNN